MCGGECFALQASVLCALHASVLCALHASVLCALQASVLCALHELVGAGAPSACPPALARERER